ncbi:response regulator [Tepidamorphus sp. 3E244]|uniref:response regulator n=1 Tax=Tepidamorphus sp. 3E244 TaxID=3385498 RepID=UPI0038FC24DA
MQELNAGSCVTRKRPAEMDGPSVDDERDDKSSGDKVPYRVLIIDDDADDIYLMRNALSHAADYLPGPVAISTAQNGAEALDALNTAHREGALPDLILLDLNMPVMDGLTMLTHCRADTIFNRLSIVVVTTASDPRSHAQARALGASAVHVKPATRDEMVKVMTSVTTQYLLD